ncbi:MAG TPA: polyprenol monophosphomannose synthase [Nocardioidaceae bacterium]|nr:polyprenol monophosphomannose synthase [Nocardioidaceae bacterium]
MTSRRALVVIPTLNEAMNVEAIVDRVRTSVPSAHVLVVDDSSPDGTGEIADKLAEHDTAVHVLHRQGRRGLGTAYLAGFGWGLDRRYDVFVELDADGSHLPEQLPRLLAALDDADVALGSRWVPGGRVVNWPLPRQVLSRGANLYARTAIGLPVHDATGGFRAYRREALEALDLSGVSSQGYCFQIDLAMRAVLAGLSVVEVPITFVERRLGESKMSRGIVWEALVSVARWGSERRLAQLGAARSAARNQAATRRRRG